ncbi:MAG: ubiquinone/menaquinone biosynthesis methyltransferase [Thaumarchaeota archaeon]|nr:ubiquinone/menaquinone biosynthesis methyltransferase [Nitrososphaerota archaeon]
MRSPRESGGPPAKYAEIQRTLGSPDRKVKFVMYLFSDGPKEYDFLLKILSLGRDSYWRESVVRLARPDAKSTVVDIACGTGLVSYELASRGASVVGVDVTREMLLRAKDLDPKRAFNADFVQARAENLPLRDGCADCVVISLAMRNVSSIEGSLSEMRRSVRSGGKVMSMDFTRPSGRIFAPFYRFYISRLLPALGLAISRHWNGIFTYLAGSIDRSNSPEAISNLMRKTGLRDTTIKLMTHGVTALVSGTK